MDQDNARRGTLLGSWSWPATGAVVGGRYRLSRRIGRGGMADVWSAEDRVLDRTVAVKVFRFDATAVEQQRIGAEIRMLAQLQHPGIVTLFDAGTQPDPDSAGFALPYLVMELVHGVTLAERLAAGELSDHRTTALAARLASTLSYLHGKGVVHRDIKPANILIPDEPIDGEDEAQAKLTDFGIARLVDSTHITTAGFTLGTANYLAPEQASGTGAAASADIYALGLVLLECLTGTVAYPGSGVEAALARLHRPPHIPDDLPAPWPELLAAMTAIDTAQRPAAHVVLERVTGGSAPTQRLGSGADAATSKLAIDDLPDATRRYPAQLAPPSRVASATGARRRRQVWSLVAAAVVVMGVLLGVALASNNSPAPSRPSTTISPPPTYPAVSGQLGVRLKQLQDAVG